jgi:hypothetical protein
MEAIRSQKTLLIILVVVAAAIYAVNSGNPSDTWVEINNFELNYQPNRIKVDVKVENNSDETKVFEAFSVHCTNKENRDVTFKVLNNQTESDIPAQHHTPLSLAANATTNISLIAEKNVFYRSPSDCYMAAVSWKIHGDKNYYGEAVSVTQK